MIMAIPNRISVTTLSRIRYEGVLNQVNMEDRSITLSQVRSFTEDGRLNDEILPSECVIFQDNDILCLEVLDSTEKTQITPTAINTEVKHTAQTETTNGETAVLTEDKQVPDEQVVSTKRFEELKERYSDEDEGNEDELKQKLCFYVRENKQLNKQLNELSKQLQANSDEIAEMKKDFEQKFNTQSQEIEELRNLVKRALLGDS